MSARKPVFSKSELRAFLTGLFLLAFGLRLFLVMTVDRTVWGEEPLSLWLARNIMTGQGYTHYPGVPDIITPPGFPLLVGLVDLIVKNLTAASHFWFVTAGTLTLFPIFLLCRTVYDNHVGLLAGLLYAVSPALVSGTFYGGSMNEPLYLFFLLSGTYFFLQLFKRDRSLDAPMSALCFCGAYLIRTEGSLYFFLFLGYWLIRLLFKKDSCKKDFFRLGLFVVLFAVLAFPYILYLHHVLKQKGAEVTWSITSRPAQSYAMTKALLDDDPVRYDLESWGLDHRRKQVRFYSFEGQDIPLLTLFFENPAQFFEDVWKNIQSSVQILLKPTYFGHLLLLLAFLGIFGIPWDRKRIQSEFFLMLALLPLIRSWGFYVVEKSFYPGLPILLLWSARGLAHINRWIDRTADNMKVFRYRAGAEIWIKGAGLMFLVGYFLIINYQIYQAPYASYIYDLKTVARWIQGNTHPTAVIMSRQPEIAFHANRPWIAFPHAPYPECLKYARSHQVDYWIFESDIVRSNRAHMIPILEGRIGSEELKMVHRMELPPTKVYTIYRMRKLQ